MKRENNNSLASLVLLATGLVVGVAGTILYRETQPKKANVILETIKVQFAQKGKITGSWIDYDPVEYDLYESKPLVYIGGISREEGQEIKTYNFIADAFTGDILDVYDYQV